MDFSKIRLFLFDMDGTLYLGNDLFPFTKPMLEEIKKQGKTYLFMTNNSSKSVNDYVKKLDKLGIPAVYDDFITSSQATADYLMKNHKGVRFYVSGTESFKKELASAGVIVCDTYSEDIEGVVMGYDTELTGNGANLSQGQRQLIAIARAAVADPPVMILDEATSSIDTRTEAIVQRGMDKLMEGRTVFVIAHRLSTVMNSDVIMVLDKGEIIERGNHEKLINQKGTYYQLYTGAFELE
jgi:HAD superfamily hydrolase (TIGR01450 family)